jgi:hypothetical protein
MAAPDHPSSSEDQPAKARAAAGSSTSAVSQVPAVPLPTGDARSQRRFVVVLLVAAVLLVALVAAFNAVADPYGTVGTGLLPTVTWNDRTVKSDLVEALKQAPGVVILGSSRAMKFEPGYITRRTGARAFNAGVSSGRPLDAYAFVRLLAARFPRQKDWGYLWLLDTEAFRATAPDPGLLNTPRLARYLPDGTGSSARLKDLKLLFSWQTARRSLQSIESKLEGDTGAGEGQTSQFADDGFRTFDYHDRRLQHGVPLQTGVRQIIRQATATYRDDYRNLDPAAVKDLRRTLAFMNRKGSVPVIVVSPQHPEVTSAVARLGWNARHRQVVKLLRSLQHEYRFRVLDYADVASFGGSPNDFYDGYHMTVPNTRRLIDAVLAHDRRALLGERLR